MPYQPSSAAVGRDALPLPPPARPAACTDYRIQVEPFATSSRSTAGANGRNDSRNLIFRFSAIASPGTGSPGWNGCRALAARTPCGPETSRAAARGQSRRTRRTAARRARRSPPLGAQPALDVRPAIRRTEEGAAHRVACRSGARGPPSMQVVRRSAAPSAPPASPAAGWIQSPSKCPSRRIPPLATQFSATPPARHRLRMPGSRRDVARQRQHDVFGDLWIDAARSMCRCVSGSSGWRGAPPKSASKRALVIVRPVQ